MVPPIGTVVAGVNTSTGCMAAPATPPEVMEVKISCVNIPPDGVPSDSTVSASVRTVMPVAFPAAAAPIVTPLSVILKAVLELMPTFAVVMMSRVLVGAATVAVMAATDIAPLAIVGVEREEKNTGG